MTKYQRCLNILGLSENASLAEIKSAYRQYAKKLHPDVNPSAKAQEHFLILTKAYEFVVAYKSSGHRVLTQERSSPVSDKKYGTHKNWDSQANRDYRARARDRAERRKEAYLNSEAYKNAVIYEQFFHYLALVMVVLMAFLMVYLPFTSGIKGLAMTPVIFVIAFPLWWAYVRKQFKLMSIAGFKHSVKEVSQTYPFWVGVLSVTNLLLFTQFTMSTLISSNLILLLFGIGIFVSKLITKRVLGFEKSKQNYWAWGVLPFIFNLVFLLNYVVSFSESTTTYEYQFGPYDSSGRSSLQEGLIFFKENKYDDSYFVRMYFSNEVNNSSHISLKTATGIMGMDVIKDHEFSGKRRR